MSAQVHKSAVLSGRPLALAITIALHVALVSGLLAMKVAQVVADRSTSIAVTFVDEKKPTIPVERIIDPKIVEPSDIPVPEPEVAPIPEDEVVAAVALPPADTAEPTPTTGGTAITVDTPLRYQAIRPSDEYYPPQAIRLGQQGAAIVRACVNANGRLTSAPTVVTSSQAALLDAAAITWAREALRFTAATRGGVAIPSCKEFRVNFTLH